MKAIPVAAKILGLRTVNDPVAIAYDAKEATVWMSECSNVDVTDSFSVTLRDGFGLIEAQAIGTINSLFCDHPAFVVFVEADALSVWDGESVRRLRNVAQGAPMSCTIDHDGRVFHANGVEHGYIKDGEAKAWFPPADMPLLPGDTRTLSPPPSDTHIVSVCGSRMLVGSGNFVFYSEPFDVFRFCLDEGNIPFDARIRMIRKVEDGHYIGTAKALYFLKGKDINDAEFIVVENSPVIQGTDCAVSFDVEADNDVSPVNGYMVTTERSILFLTSEGKKVDMSDSIITYPPGATGTAFVKDGRYTVIINTF